MPLLRGLRLLEAVETGNTTASCLDSLLTSDRGRYSDFSSVMVLPGQAQVIAASNIAMTCITGSNTATCVLFSYPTSSSAVLNSYTASCVLFNGPNSANVVSIMGNNTGTAQAFVNSVPGCSCIISNCNTLQSISSPTFVSYFKGCRAIAGGFYGCANVSSCWSTAQSFCACPNSAGNAPQTLIATGVFGYWNPNACTYTIGYLNNLTYSSTYICASNTNCTAYFYQCLGQTSWCCYPVGSLACCSNPCTYTITPLCNPGAVNLASGYTYFMIGNSCACSAACVYGIGTIVPSTGSVVFSGNYSCNFGDACIFGATEGFGTSTQSNGTGFFLSSFDTSNCQASMFYGDPVKFVPSSICLPTNSQLKCWTCSQWPYALAVGCNCAIAFGCYQYAWYCNGNWGITCYCCTAIYQAGESRVTSTGFFGNGVAFALTTACNLWISSIACNAFYCPCTAWCCVTRFPSTASWNNNSNYNNSVMTNSTGLTMIVSLICNCYALTTNCGTTWCYYATPANVNNGWVLYGLGPNFILVDSGCFGYNSYNSVYTSTNGTTWNTWALPGCCSWQIMSGACNGFAFFDRTNGASVVFNI